MMRLSCVTVALMSSTGSACVMRVGTAESMGTITCGYLDP
jgi:hypothetical protein